MIDEGSVVVDIASVLLTLRVLSPEELRRVAHDRGWRFSSLVSGIWEAGDRYPVALDSSMQPPIILCPFLGTDESPRLERRKMLRSSFDAMLARMRGQIGPEAVLLTWAKDDWAAAIWRGPHVLLSMEETNYENETPFLALACVDSSGVLPAEGLTARAFADRNAQPLRES